ncbi:MAG: hypothetical protein KAT65_16850 [Methanophagales archaeon]|nr:hypothetical protein [Methanophagales archaeon]
MRRQCNSYGMLMASLLTRHDELPKYADSVSQVRDSITSFILPNYVDRRNNVYMNKLSEMVLCLMRG